MRTAPALLDTPHLRLRPPEPDDCQAIFESYAADPEVTRYVWWPTHRSIRDTEAFLSWSAQEWSRSPSGPYLICDRSGGRVLGGTGLTFEASGRVITGYVLARDVWGRGYATEALRAMVALARALEVERLHAECHADHAASRRVLEKCGFTLEGIQSTIARFPNLDPDLITDVCAYVHTLVRTH
ncbi:MAG TPA: GNAT family N-acetyltransferase [Vicinamibacterales bacterium]